MTFAEAMAAEQRQLNLKATIHCVDGFIINNADVMSVSIDEGGQMPLGSAVSARYTLELPNADGEYLRNGSILGNRSLTGARVTIQIGVYHDGAWDWQPLGLFIVEKTSAREHDTRIRLTGNDPLILLDVAYGADIVYRNNTTLNSILTHIRSKGFTINGTLAVNGTAVINFTPDWGDEPTVREVLGYVAQMGGSFVRCNRNGVIELAPANSSTTHTITTDRYLEFTDDERYFNFNRIKVLPYGAKKSDTYVQSTVTSAAESAANTIVVEGNPLFKTKTTTSYYKASVWREGAQYYVLSDNKYEAVPKDMADESALPLYYLIRRNYNTTNLQTMVDNLKTALTGMSFRATNFTWRGNPQVMVGDKVAIVDTRGVTTTTVNLQQTLRFDRGFKSEISCPLDLQAVYPSTITSSGRVVPPYFGEGTIDGVAIASNSLTGAQIADGSITNSQIKGGTITGTEISDSTIKTSHFQDGTISGSIFTDGTIDGSKITDSTIENSHFVAGTIEGSSIKGGTIDGTHIYSGTADNLKIQTASIKDAAITNAKIANATLETAKIKDAAITTAKIADAQVTNAKIANATIETAKIKDAAITTAKIQDAQITNAKIAAAGIDFANIKDVVAGTSIFRQGVGDALYLDRLVVNDANFSSAIAGKLMIRDTDGKLYRISVNSSGAVTATQVQVNGDSLTDNAVMSVSQRLLWRQATQPSAPWVGMLWLDTTTEKLKRCTAITPSVAWEVVPAGEVHTAVIDVDDSGMNILSGGNLNLLSGGAINIKNLGNTANVINMDNTGLTLSSTGQLKLQSADSIVIGGNPFGVGGTNLLKASDTVISSNSHITQTYTPTEPMIAGEIYTISMMVTPAANVTYFNPHVSGGMMGLVNLVVSGTSKQLVRGTFTASYWPGLTPSDNIAYADVRIYRFPNDGTVTTSSTIHWIKLETGTMATDWSPSPQDTVDALTGLGTDISELADNKTTVFYGGTPTATATGDIWYDTGSTPTIVKRWNGTDWIDITDNALAKALSQINTLSSDMVQVFTGNTLPTAANVKMGDMWYFSGTNRTGKVDGRTYRASINGASADNQWTQFDAGAVYTPYISLAADQLVLNGQSSLIMQSATTGNAIVMDGTGMTIQANHGLTLAAAADIRIGSTAYGDVLADTIDLSANNSVKLAAQERINLTVGNLHFPTRNIVLRSGQRKESSVRYVGTWRTIEPLIDGEEYILTIKGTVSIPGSPFGIWQSIYHPMLGATAYDAEKDIWVGRFTANSNGTGNTTEIHVYLAIVDAVSTLEWIQVARGNMVKPYYPASGEDINHIRDSKIGMVSQAYGFGARTVPTLLPNTTYTLSARGKGNTSTHLMVEFQLNDNTGNRFISVRLYGNATTEGSVTFTTGTSISYIGTLQGYSVGGQFVEWDWCQLEEGAVATPWKPHVDDPASGVKTSSVEVNTNGIYMDTTGTFNVNAGVGVNILGGTGATSIGVSNNKTVGTDKYFLWAGNAAPESAPFSVKMDGSVKATKIQHEMPYTFWDMADSSTPAEFPLYIPANYTVDSVTFTFQTKKARTFAKSASSGGGSTSSTKDGYNLAQSNQYTNAPLNGNTTSTHVHLAPHSHWIDGHSHTIYAHTHDLDYGINEKATLATSCALKVGATTIGTYAPDPSAPVEIKTYLSTGWNTVIVAPNDDARIVAFALVKLTPA